MCHAYSITTNVEALRQAVRAMFKQTVFDFDVADNVGNMAPQTGIYPDMLAPIIRNRPGFRHELVKIRWGMPTPSNVLYRAAQARADKVAKKRGREFSVEEFAELLRMEPDGGVHNVRNTDSPHWRASLAPEFRILVPFTSFAEFSSEIGPDGKKLGNTWFAFDLDRPVGFFAGIFAPQHTSAGGSRDLDDGALGGSPKAAAAVASGRVAHRLCGPEGGPSGAGRASTVLTIDDAARGAAIGPGHPPAVA
jgi:putative SOS response-associated peptidase YedK